MKNFKNIFFILTAFLLLNSCLSAKDGKGYLNKASNPLYVKDYKGYYKIGKPYTVSGNTYYPKEYKSYKKRGIASWYGKKFHGRQTANGEIYNLSDFTAAHPTLPLPSIVKVTNLQNGRSIIARVNDRGPFAKDRIIDVSQKIAYNLGFINKGTARVEVELLPYKTKQLHKNLNLR